MGSLSEAIGRMLGQKWGRCTHIDPESPKHRPRGLGRKRLRWVDNPRNPCHPSFTLEGLSVREAREAKSEQLWAAIRVAYDANKATEFDGLCKSYITLGKQLHRKRRSKPGGVWWYPMHEHALYLEYPSIFGWPEAWEGE